MDEAIALRNKGIVAPILVLGATRPEDVQVALNYDITITIIQEEWLKAAQTYLPKDKELSVHIKLDTGMGRIGIRSKEELAAIEQIILTDDRIKLEGIFTHFATADELDQTYFQKQMELFIDLLGVLKTPS